MAALVHGHTGDYAQERIVVVQPDMGPGPFGHAQYARRHRAETDGRTRDRRCWYRARSRRNTVPGLVGEARAVRVYSRLRRDGWRMVREHGARQLRADRGDPLGVRSM